MAATPHVISKRFQRNPSTAPVSTILARPAPHLNLAHDLLDREHAQAFSQGAMLILTPSLMSGRQPFGNP